MPLPRAVGTDTPPFFPLCQGFLTAQIKRAEDHPEDDFRRNDPSPGCCTGVLESFPMRGTKRRTYLGENVAAAAISLDGSRMMTGEEALMAGKGAGHRLAAAMMSIAGSRAVPMAVIPREKIPGKSA